MSKQIALENCKRCRRLYNHLQKPNQNIPTISVSQSQPLVMKMQAC